MILKLAKVVKEKVEGWKEGKREKKEEKKKEEKQEGGKTCKLLFSFP